MIFHHPQKIPRFQLEINDTPIECVDNFNFLGLTINKHLNWKNHIDKLACKISRSIGIIRKIKQFVPQHVLVNLYNSLVLPHINYCLLSWGIQQDRILKLQKRAIRVVTYSRYNAHAEPLFKNLNILMVTDIIRLQQLKFGHRYINCNLPEYFSRLGIRENEDVETHYTRNRHDIHVERANTELARKSLRFSIAHVQSRLVITRPVITRIRI